MSHGTGAPLYKENVPMLFPCPKWAQGLIDFRFFELFAEMKIDLW